MGDENWTAKDGLIKYFTCSECKKRFSIPTFSLRCWAYKKGVKKYCSWGCLRKSEAKTPRKGKKYDED